MKDLALAVRLSLDMTSFRRDLRAIEFWLLEAVPVCDERTGQLVMRKELYNRDTVRVLTAR